MALHINQPRETTPLLKRFHVQVRDTISPRNERPRGYRTDAGANLDRYLADKNEAEVYHRKPVDSGRVDQNGRTWVERFQGLVAAGPINTPDLILDTQQHSPNTRGFNSDVVRCPRTTYILEVWPESHWPGFALRQADVTQSYTAW